MKLNGKAHPAGDEPAHPSLEPTLLMLACTAEWVESTDVKIIEPIDEINGVPLVLFRCPRCLANHKSFPYLPA